MFVGVPEKPLPNTLCCENSSDIETNSLRALTGLQALLRWDSTIVFHGIGKRKLNIVRGNEE